MAWTSPTTINATRGFADILPYLNEVTENWISRMLLIGIWIIFLFGYLRVKGDNDIISGMAVSSYVTFVLATLLWIIGFVSGLDMAIVVGVTLISTAMLLLDKK